MTSAARIDPIPPHARTSPKSSAPAPRSLRMRNGTSTSTGPQYASRKTAAARSVAQSHARARTKASPSRTSRSIDAPTDSRSKGRGRMRKIAVAEARNVPASRRNASPGPIVATSQPPRAGPTSMKASGRMNWSSELASSSRFRGTIWGTTEVAAGPKNASPVPKTAASATRCHSSIWPVTERTPIVAAASARTTSAAIITRRRSTRSVTTPPTSTKSPTGSVHATPTIESAGGRSRRFGSGAGRRSIGSVRAPPERPREAAAALAGLRERPRIALHLEMPQLAQQLPVALEPFGGQPSVGDRGQDCAPGLPPVGAVAEPARRGQLGHVREGLVDAVARLPEAQLAHAGRVEDEAAARQRDQLPVRRRVPALAVLTDVCDVLPLAPQEPVDERRLPDTGRAEQRARAVALEVPRETVEAGSVRRAHDVDGDAERDRLHPRRRAGDVVGQVALVEDDDRVGAAVPAGGQVTLEAAHVEVGAERAHEEDDVHVGGHDLLARPAGRLPREDRPARQESVDRGGVRIRRVADGHPVADRRQVGGAERGMAELPGDLGGALAALRVDDVAAAMLGGDPRGHAAGGGVRDELFGSARAPPERCELVGHGETPLLQQRRTTRDSRASVRCFGGSAWSGRTAREEGWRTLDRHLALLSSRNRNGRSLAERPAPVSPRGRRRRQRGCAALPPTPCRRRAPPRRGRPPAPPRGAARRAPSRRPGSRRPQGGTSP